MKKYLNYLLLVLCICLIGCGSEEKGTEGENNLSVKEDTTDEKLKATATPVPKKSTEGLVYVLNADKESYSVASIGSATELEIVIASEYEGLPVTGIMDDAFAECKEIISVVIPEGVTKIGQRAFKECSKLHTVVIPESVTSILNEAFYQCRNLQNVTLPENLEALGEGAFYECESLNSIVIPVKVEQLRNKTFMRCVNLAEVIFADGSICTNIGERVFQECDALTEISLPSSLGAIAEGAFYSCKSLVQVELPEGLKSICAMAFRYCENLKEITLPSTLNYLEGGVFSDCKSIIELVVPEGVTEIGDSFCENCVALSSIVLPDTVTYIGDAAFKNCTSLKNFIIPRGVKSLGDVKFGALEGCMGIEKLSISVIDEQKAINNLFGVSVNSKSAKVPDSLREITITDAEFINQLAFSNLTNLEKVVIKSAITDIFPSAFAGCTSLNEVVFEDSSRLKKIWNDAFAYCGFTSFEIPEGVEEVGAGVFGGSSVFKECEKLTSLSFPSTVKYVFCGWLDDTALTSVVFANPNGWTCKDKSIDLSDPTENAELFRDKYNRELERK